MTYRECEIKSSKVLENYYEWQHPNYVDYDQHGQPIWYGGGQSIEDCIFQIDQWYERFGL